MSEYLDLTPLSDSDIKFFAKHSIMLTDEEKICIQRGRYIDKKAPIVADLEKSYKVRLFFKTYNSNKVLYDTSILMYIPKGKLKYTKGKYTQKLVELQKVKEND